MYRSRGIAFLAVLFIARPCAAGPALPAPAVLAQGPPQFGMAEIGDGKEGIIITSFNPVRETRTRLVEQTVDGKTVRKTETYTVTKAVGFRRPIQARDFRISRDGQWLDPTAHAELLKQATPVVICDFEALLDPFYLGFLKPGALVVHLRAVAPEPSRAKAKAPRPSPVPPVVP